MSNRTVRLFSKKGFTLVELLIVVAIIGVLASQGVPAYRRMIQKSRRGEVQTLLGNIGSAEAGFFSEYNQYGNNIVRMGAQMETNANLRYMGGFMTTGCANQANVVPSTLTGFSGYTALTAKSSTTLGTMLIGANVTSTSGCPAAVTPDATTYTASAIGNIHTSAVDLATSSTSDQWTVNQNRQLNNVTDGVQ